MRRGSGLNILGIIFGILSIFIVIFAAATLLGRQPLRLPIDFKIDLPMETIEDVFSSGNMEEEGREEFRGEIDDLSVENISGKIDITGWDEDYIELIYIKSAPSQKYLDALTVNFEERGSSLAIERDFIGEGFSPRGSIVFQLKIPAEKIKELSVKSVSGRIICINLTEELNLQLQTTSSRIQTDACRDLSAKTISGEINFISYGDEVEIQSTSGRVEGEYRSTAGRGGIDIHTVSGAVRLVLPEGFQGDVDLRSISGSVDSEFPIEVTSSRRNSIEGSIGGGGVKVNINTTAGAIRLIKTSGNE